MELIRRRNVSEGLIRERHIKPLSRIQYKEMKDSAVSDLCKARSATFSDQGRLLLGSTEKDHESGL